PAGVAPDAPEVMQAWLIQWQRFTEQVTVWKGIRLKCQEDEQRITTLRAQLVDACPITRTAKTLAEGLALARQAISDAKSGQTAAQKLNDEVLRLQAALATAEAESVRAQKRRDTWTEQWSAAIGVLRLREPSVSVKTAQDYLKRIAEMQQHLTDMRIKAARGREIDEERALLLQRLTALRQRLDSATRPTTADTSTPTFTKWMPPYRRPAFAALSTTNLPSVSRRSGLTSPQPPTPCAKPKPLSLPWLPKPELWGLSILRRPCKEPTNAYWPRDRSKSRRRRWRKTPGVSHWRHSSPPHSCTATGSIRTSTR